MPRVHHSGCGLGPLRVWGSLEGYILLLPQSIWPDNLELRKVDETNSKKHDLTGFILIFMIATDLAEVEVLECGSVSIETL